jgi:hypothetical protein
MNQARIDRLIESRSLEPLPAEDDEVAAIWGAALREWSDSAVPGLSTAGSFTHVYQAAFRAATTLIRAAGYRTRGAVGGHHHVTFYFAALLGDAELERISDRMQGIRGDRHAALYGDEEAIEPDDLDRARMAVRELLAHTHRWIAAARPSILARLPAPPTAPR